MSALRKSEQSAIDSSETSAIDFAPYSPAASVTARISGLSRVPSHSGHGHVAHEALVALLHLLGVGLLHAALQERHHAFEVGVVRTGAAVPVLVPDVHLLVAALEDRLARLGRKLAPRGVDVEAECVAETPTASG